MLGLELRDTLATAVAVDDGGNVLARAAIKPADDLAGAASRALDSVAPASAGAGALGIAAPNPEATELAAVVRSLAGRYTGAFLQNGVSSSGTAAAVAEAWVGAARDARDVVFFAVADHATAGFVRNGEPIFGAHRRAVSVGWLALNPVEREDYRKMGCLEAEVAEAGIVRRLIWRIKAGDRSSVAEAVNGDLSAITALQVLEAARAQDGVSISVVRDTAKYLGMAAANLVAIADPEILVLGGIIASAADLLLEPIRTELGRRLSKPMMDALTIATARLGLDSPAIGAARLAAVTVQ
jgi:predicted NBD/HSP70 family sugar kinase